MIDRKSLVRQLKELRGLAVLSQRAAGDADSLAARLSLLDRLGGERRALDELAGEVERRVAAGEAVPFRAELLERTASPDETVARALREAGELSAKLRRTLFRGVYRQGERYVVPWFDNLGRERRQLFSTLAEARSFRKALRQAEQAQVPSHYLWGQQESPTGHGGFQAQAGRRRHESSRRNIA